MANAKSELVEQLLRQIEELTAKVAELNAVIDAQAQLIARQDQTIRQLQERLNKNSKNSSKPPSSDGLNKPAPKSLRKPSGRKAGGQKGHQGTTLAILSEPDEIIKHMPSACEGCPHYQMCKGTACIAEKRHVIDAVVSVNVTEHQSLEIPICMLHGGIRKGEFPSEVKAAVQYGANLQALAVAFNTVGAVSINRTHEILSGVFSIPISTGTITSMVKRCADRVTGTVAQIKEKLIHSQLDHFDETGTRAEGKLHWVHSASNTLYTLLDISRKRGCEGMDECGVLPGFKGIAVHDCWASYWNYSDAKHAVCCAHLLRELIGIHENHPGQTWAPAFIDLLLEMKEAKEEAIVKGETGLSQYALEQFDKRYDKLIELAKKENPLPEVREKKRGRKKKGKVLALAERLETYKAEVCLFVRSFSVPFDNNQAERDIRVIKVKTKVSGCFRTVEGARDYLKIMSYVGTARKHGYNAYNAIFNAISGHSDFIFV